MEPGSEEGEHVESRDHVDGHGVLNVAPQRGHGARGGGRAIGGEEAVAQHLRKLDAGQSQTLLVDAHCHLRAPRQRVLVLRPRRLRHLHQRLP